MTLFQNMFGYLSLNQFLTDISSINNNNNNKNNEQAIVSFSHQASVVDEELKYRLGQCCSKLQSLAYRLQEMTSLQQQRSRYGQADFENSDFDGIMAELNKLRAEIKEREQSAADEKLQVG